jgi:transcriptional regulator with XRE-family HTH domain
MLPCVSNSTHRRQTGSRLGVAIEALGKTQAEVCRTLGVSPSKLGNWIRGDYYPDPYFVAQFCDRYGITADWIYRNQAGAVAGDVGDALWVAARAFESDRPELALPAPGQPEAKPKAPRGRPKKINAG